MTEALLPFEREGILFAGGVRAGDWVFGSEICGSARIDPKRPLSGEPAAYLEAKSMYARALEVLKAGGVDFGAVVRADQYFRDWRAVPFFHQARREACGNYIAPSTSAGSSSSSPGCSRRTARATSAAWRPRRRSRKVTCGKATASSSRPITWCEKSSRLRSRGRGARLPTW